MLLLLIASLTAFALENGLEAQTLGAKPSQESSSETSESKQADIIDSFLYYASLKRYGATLASVGLQMDASQYTQFQIEGPALQTPVLFRFESAQYTFGKGGSFLRTGVGFLHKFRRPLEGMVYEPDKDFGLGMHYVYDWLNTKGNSSHVLGFDMYVAKIETIFKLTIEIPSGSRLQNLEPLFGLQAGFGDMVNLIP